MNGLCGGIAGGFDSGHDGFGGYGFGEYGFGEHGLAAMDFLSGPESTESGEHCQGLNFNGIFVSPDGEIFATHVLGHRSFLLETLIMNVAEHVGLKKVPSILVGQQVLVAQRSSSILPTDAWSGAKDGAMPRGYACGMTGSTLMFRYYFQIPKREWFFSDPVYDKDAGAYLDVSCMNWDYSIGDSESQLIVRVVPMARFNDPRQMDKIDAHRKAALAVVTRVHDVLISLAPSAQVVEARRSF